MALTFNARTSLLVRGWNSRLPLQGTWVGALVGDLRSFKPRGTTKSKHTSTQEAEQVDEGRDGYVETSKARDRANKSRGRNILNRVSRRSLTNQMTKRKPFEDRLEANEGKSPVPTWEKTFQAEAQRYPLGVLGEQACVSEAEQSVGEGRRVGSEVGEVPGGTDKSEDCILFRRSECLEALSRPLIQLRSKGKKQGSSKMCLIYRHR